MFSIEEASDIGEHMVSMAKLGLISGGKSEAEIKDRTQIIPVIKSVEEGLEAFKGDQFSLVCTLALGIEDLPLLKSIYQGVEGMPSWSITEIMEYHDTLLGKGSNELLVAGFFTGIRH
ncbi:MAG: hypothetical protein Q7R49_06920 [Candidatus Daviesbacteria bacterium]|nr:hypothetical protein [Candidatus Daviesbacteria bacterium]